MNHKQRTVLHSLFAHPISCNIDPKAAFTMIEALGGEISHGGAGHVIVKLAGHTHGFHDVKHDLSKDQVSSLRKFLELAGVDPTRDFPLAG